MRLLNYNELKTLLLEERDKIPLTVPGARYEMNIPQPNKHGESMRGGIRIALRCMERCHPFALDDLCPKGRWDLDEKRRPYCTNCKKVAIQFENKAYYVPDFCYHCGADMRGGGEDG